MFLTWWGGTWGHTPVPGGLRLLFCLTHYPVRLLVPRWFFCIYLQYRGGGGWTLTVVTDLFCTLYKACTIGRRLGVLRGY